MNNQILKSLSLVAAVLLLSLSLSARPFAGSDPAGSDAPLTVPFKNRVKINASSLFFKTASFQYERITGSKTSLGLGFRLTPRSGLPLRSVVESQNGVDGDESTREFISTCKVGGFAITPEFRYYFGKSAGQGLYIAPFLRYEKFFLKSVYPLDGAGNETVSVAFKGNAATLGAGILLGAQFRLNKRLSLDWWILGPYYTSNTLKLSATDLDLNSEEQATLRESLDGVEVAWLKLDADVSRDKVAVKAKGSFAAIRGFGLCLSVTF